MASERYLSWNLDKTFDDVTDGELEQALDYLRRRKGEEIDAQHYEDAAALRHEERRFVLALGGKGLMALYVDKF
jgi:hypothetical protein